MGGTPRTAVNDAGPSKCAPLAQPSIFVLFKDTEIGGGPEVRVTTLLNKLIKLQGLSVRGVRFEGDALVMEVHRRFDSSPARSAAPR
jgi:hypothetical protein